MSRERVRERRERDVERDGEREREMGRGRAAYLMYTVSSLWLPLKCVIMSCAIWDDIACPFREIRASYRRQT